MTCFRGLEEIYQPDVSLAEHTWYGLGGPARWLLTPRDEDELATVLRRCAEHDVAWRVLGRGANVLVRDEGFDGAVIKLSTPAWETIEIDGPLVTAAAGVDFPRLVRDTAERGLRGLENLAGIPGTVGGALHSNAGGRHGCISDYLRSARIMCSDGSCRVRQVAELGLGYRTSDLGGVAVSATFELQPGERGEAMTHFRAIWTEKYDNQPPVAAKSAGCIFKNPPEGTAGRLLDAAGLKGERRGAAEISPKHANFIIAHPGARARDVLELIEHAKDRVRGATGIELQLEVEVW